jgi:two-component system sensor histidine kinase PilS (NtrC family)
MLSRVALVTILFSFTTYIKLQKTDLFPEISLTPLYIIFTVTYALSILYLCIHKFRLIENPKVNIYIQSFSDVFLVTGLVYATGGVTSIYSVLYPLVIIYAVLFLEKRGGLIIATFSSTLYGLLIDLEYYRIIHPIYSTTFRIGICIFTNRHSRSVFLYNCFSRQLCRRTGKKGKNAAR